MSKEDIEEVMRGEDFDINVLMEEPPGRLLNNLSNLIAPTLSTSSCQAPRPISFEYNSADSHANYCAFGSLSWQCPLPAESSSSWLRVRHRSMMRH